MVIWSLDNVMYSSAASAAAAAANDAHAKPALRAPIDPKNRARSDYRLWADNIT